MEYKFDAADKILGRLASEVAVILRGKNLASFNPARLSQNKVKVFNLDRIQVSGKKMAQKVYRRHSGYHGGLKAEKLGEVMARDSRLAFRRAVSGMLPKNKLRARLLKNLILFKGEK